MMPSNEPLNLQKDHNDLGEYLYESGRCAVAHAFSDPIVDPDDPEDTARLAADLPLIRSLARLLIENELGVRSRVTYYHEHLYQLEGFRDLFGTAVAELKARRELRPNALPQLPRLSVRVRDYPSYRAFEGMKAEVTEVTDGCVFIDCFSVDGLVTLHIGLNFPDEQIEFDLESSIARADDGSVKAAEIGLDAIRFFRELVKNGELEIWNSETGKLMGRADPLIPMNIDLRRTLRNSDILQERWETILSVRSAPFQGACDI